MEDIIEINSILIKLNGFNFKIWEFDKTFSRLKIRIWKPSKLINDEQYFLNIAGCISINCEFFKENVCLKVLKHNLENGIVEYNLLDEFNKVLVVFLGGIIFDEPP